MSRDIYTTFHNVRITIPGCTPREAYDRLCEALDSIEGVDWETDTYTVGDDNYEHGEKPTTELFPKD